MNYRPPVNNVQPMNNMPFNPHQYIPFQYHYNNNNPVPPPPTFNHHHNYNHSNSGPHPGFNQPMPPPRQNRFIQEEFPVKREEFSVKREESSTKREESWTKKEESQVKREEPSIRREEPWMRREDPPIRREQPQIRREESFLRREEPQVRREKAFSPPSRSRSKEFDKDSFKIKHKVRKQAAVPKKKKKKEEATTAEPLMSRKLKKQMRKMGEWVKGKDKEDKAGKKELRKKQLLETARNTLKNLEGKKMKAEGKSNDEINQMMHSVDMESHIGKLTSRVRELKRENKVNKKIKQAKEWQEKLKKPQLATKENRRLAEEMRPEKSISVAQIQLKPTAPAKEKKKKSLEDIEKKMEKMNELEQGKEYSRQYERSSSRSKEYDPFQVVEKDKLDKFKFAGSSVQSNGVPKTSSNFSDLGSLFKNIPLVPAPMHDAPLSENLKDLFACQIGRKSEFEKAKAAKEIKEPGILPSIEKQPSQPEKPNIKREMEEEKTEPIRVKREEPVPQIINPPIFHFSGLASLFDEKPLEPPKPQQAVSSATPVTQSESEQDGKRSEPEKMQMEMEPMETEPLSKFESFYKEAEALVKKEMQEEREERVEERIEPIKVKQEESLASIDVMFGVESGTIETTADQRSPSPPRELTDAGQSLLRTASDDRVNIEIPKDIVIKPFLEPRRCQEQEEEEEQQIIKTVLPSRRESYQSQPGCFLRKNSSHPSNFQLSLTKTSNSMDPRRRFGNILASSEKLNLVLDLDETLVNFQNFPQEFDIEEIKSTCPYELHVMNTGESKAIIAVRPYTCQFLNRVSQYYNIYVYSHGKYEFIQNVIDIIDKKRRLIKQDNVYQEDNDNCNTDSSPKLLSNLLFGSAEINKTLILDDQKSLWEQDSEKVLCVKKFIPLRRYIDEEKLSRYTLFSSRDGELERLHRQELNYYSETNVSHQLEYMATFLEDIADEYSKIKKRSSKRGQGLPSVEELCQEKMKMILKGIKLTVVSGIGERRRVFKELTIRLGAELVNINSAHYILADNLEEGQKDKVVELVEQKPLLDVLSPYWLTECLFCFKRVSVMKFRTTEMFMVSD